jgi:translation initiation factor IF-2
MTEHQGSGDNKPGGPRRLELKKTIEGGQVRQSFAHGRSKLVKVEVRKKRTYTTDARGRLAKLPGEGEHGAEAAAPSPTRVVVGEGVPREGAAVSLTVEEKAARQRALEHAIRAEEALEHEAVESEAPPAEIGAVSPPALPEAPPAALEEPAPPPAEQATTPAVEDASAAATAEADSGSAVIAAEPQVEPAAPFVPRPPAAQVVATEEDELDTRGRPKKTLRAEPRRVATPVKTAEQRRRSGKISVHEALDDRSEDRIRSLAAVRRAREKERLKQRMMQDADAQKIRRDVVIPETITVQELSNRMAARGADVIKALFTMGVMATINQTIDADTAELVATEFGHNVKRVSDADVEIGLKGEADREENLARRPPVVTVMGHVDHGKTSLLDALRQTDVAAHEAGGITQHIGAYQITLASGDKVTFIDTPGHAAFTQMRARGAHVTDIVVLVVAADDGVMPQTIEAINHAKAASVPMIVAINKIDRPEADPQKVRMALLQHDVVLEDVGGETLSVEVSAKTGTNLPKLLETILLQAEVLDLRSNPDRPAEGVVIEAKIERGRGSVATVLVQRGTLRVGDIFVAGSEWGRVRGLMDAAGTVLDGAGPGTPVEVLGLNGTPAAGDEVVVVDSEARAREVTDFRRRRHRDARTAAVGKASIERIFDRIAEGRGKSLPVVIKADVHGSAEAICGALEKLSTDEVSLQILHSAVGGINESDVTLAAASNALIMGFNVRANPQAREMAKRDGVEIRYYAIIYDVVDDMKKMLSGLMAPRLKENILGYAEIRQVFSITKVGKVAGCMVTEGQIRRGARVRLLRDDVVIHEGDLSQLKRFKEDVREVKEGYDCGVALAHFQDINEGDVIECFEIQQEERSLA